MDLEELRNSIRECDREIISLIERRQKISQSIAEVKNKLGLEILDEVQRRKVIDHAASLAEEYSIDKNAIINIFTLLIRMSEDVQKIGRGGESEKK